MIGWKLDSKDIGDGKKMTNVAYKDGLDWFTVGGDLKDKVSHAVCKKCSMYAIENNQMKQND